MHVCFVCPNAGDLFSSRGRSVGGAERQVALLGRELARRGHRVTFVVHAVKDMAAEPLRLVPVRLRADLPRGVGKLINFAQLWRGLRRADPDCFLQHGAGTITLDVALFARVSRRPFIFMAASDEDFLLRTFHADRGRNFLYRWGLRLADVVVAQTERQRTLARERFAREAVVVPYATEVPPEVPAPGSEILWVGMLRPYKRPGAVLTLARALPQCRFTVVGGAPTRGAPGEAEAAQAFFREAAKLPNVACAGFQPPEKLDAFYARAAVVINTSPVEGFPTALLEGWARGRPAATAGVDPDEVICRHGLGLHARGLVEMAQGLGKLMDDDALRKRMGENARRYVETHHAVGAVADRYERLLRKRLAPRRHDGNADDAD